MVGVWSLIFLCHIRYRRLSDAGIVTKSPFRAPLAPFMSYVGLAFLLLVLVGMAYSGWKGAPEFWDKTNFIVVVVGIPVFVVVLVVGWFAVKPAVIEHTGGDLAAAWSLDDAPNVDIDKK